MERKFEVCGAPIESVTEVKYLGIILTATNDDWPVVIGKLGKARRSLGRLSRVLGREGADQKVSRAFYIAVTQAVLLFGAETWVLTLRMEKALDSLQSRVARKITGIQPRRRTDRSWEYPPLVAQYIATQPIIDLCKQATHWPGARVSRRL